MQPLRIVIPGEYWDSQIYSGRLFLFERTGDIRTLDWDKTIQEWAVTPKLRIALECAFRRSDYLYGDRWNLLLSDEEIKDLILRKFHLLGKEDLVLPTNRLEKVTLGRQKNPFPFPHSDLTIYQKNMYAASKSGLFRASCGTKTTHPVSTRPEKKWDGPIHSLAASYGNLALASGSEGLFEFEINQDHARWDSEKSPISQLSKKHCSSCNWLFYSIYGSSHTESGGFLASFEKHEKIPDYNNRRNFERKPDGILSDTAIFKDAGFSWGAQDKICQAVGGDVHVVRYTPWSQDPSKKIEHLGKLEVRSGSERVISGAVAMFGTVIEYDDGLIALLSDGRQHRIPGEPVSWRVFSRSKHYENQLHVIYEDQLVILSFNHDYFVSQEEKLSGFKRFGGAEGYPHTF
jgi:hypothetical protein